MVPTVSTCNWMLLSGQKKLNSHAYLLVPTGGGDGLSATDQHLTAPNHIIVMALNKASALLLDTFAQFQTSPQAFGNTCDFFLAFVIEHVGHIWRLNHLNDVFCGLHGISGQPTGCCRSKWCPLCLLATGCSYQANKS